MNTKNFIPASIAGGLVYFFMGWLIYGMLLTDFMMNNQGSATGVMRAEAEMVWWALILGNLMNGFLLSFIFTRVGNINTAAAGAKTGAWLGFFMASGFDLMMYATSNTLTLNGAFADIAAFTLISAIAGVVVATVVAKAKA